MKKLILIMTLTAGLLAQPTQCFNFNWNDWKKATLGTLAIATCVGLWGYYKGWFNNKTKIETTENKKNEIETGTIILQMRHVRLEMDVPKTSTVKEFKEIIQTKTGIPSDLMQIIEIGREMDDEDCLYKVYIDKKLREVLLVLKKCYCNGKQEKNLL